ncbi:MAG: DUF6273 domain-containing protein [Coriobacteriia bacterium]|nr:DUF6273 domain-containing protein [Coriobacteriia bacterium]
MGKSIKKNKYFLFVCLVIVAFLAMIIAVGCSNQQPNQSSSVKTNYVVSIWGINHDGDNTITFGPAIGNDKSCLEHDGHHQHCLAHDSWDEIISNIKAGHADYYADCLKEGCTHTVELNLNGTIKGERASDNSKESVLYDSIAEKYLKWNYNYSGSEKDFNYADWSKCRMRATLNGKTDQDPKYAGPDCLDSNNCLFSCFPDVLKNSIKEKAYKVPIEWNTSNPYTITNEKEIKDKLWLPNATEVFNFPTQSNSFGDYGKQYEKCTLNGITATNAKANQAYNENGYPYNRWLRSPLRSYFYHAAITAGTGGNCSSFMIHNPIVGISPFFIL